MQDGIADHRYELVSYRWESTTEAGRAKLAGLLRTNAGNAAKFCALYFERFDLVHKLGHIYMELFDREPSRPRAESDYRANLFAVKYFQHKKEGAYLSALQKWFDVLLEAYGVNIDPSSPRALSLYEEYRKDIRTFGAFHFASVKKCLDDDSNLEAVLRKLGNRDSKAPNSGIIFRPGLRGMDLVHECLMTVFEMNAVYPEIAIDYRDELRLEEVDAIRKRTGLNPGGKVPEGGG
jgi:hypothetical protein